jgi:subtilisin family serine protease
MPVRLVLDDPALTAPEVKHRPTVAVLDTGLGRHDWFADPASATEEVYAGGVLLGLHGPFGSPTVVPPVDLAGAVPPLRGHGLFIAGLVRQRCPQARILGIPVTDDSGWTDEHALTRALALLLARHVAAQAAGDPDGVVDVLSLSLGYYHEQPGDAATTSSLAGVLADLGAHGVCVVAAAGNDASLAPLIPAGLGCPSSAAMPGGGVPLVAVGALNPDGATTAWFSNEGAWVTAQRPGANLVSTFPVDTRGSSQASAAHHVLGRHRASIDLDDFSSGFATWSGTSFAAPVLAGELARHVAEHGDGDPAQATAVARGREALCSAIPEWGP